MKNTELFANIIDSLSSMLNSYDFKILHRKSATDFTRKGVIGFANTVMLLLNFFNKTSFIEIYNFFDRVLKVDETPSRQAFEQARKKVSHTAFVVMFNVSTEMGLDTVDPRLYMGHRILAIDGSTAMVENSKELKKHFGETTPVKDAVFARISMSIDVLNGFITDARIGPFSTGERIMAATHIEQLSKLNSNKSITLLDRGYWSPELVSLFCEGNNKFLMRVPKKISKTITNSIKSSGNFVATFNELAYTLRFFKFTLKSGETEILVTNLDSNEFSDEKLSDLYFMRWGIETKYRELKSMLQLENFTGKTVISVQQDFYATVLLSNVVAFAKLQSDENIAQAQEGKDLKHKYKSNTSITIGLLKDRLILALLASNPIEKSSLLNRIIRAIARIPTAIIPNRSNPRKESSIKYRKRTVSKKSM